MPRSFLIKKAGGNSPRHDIADLPGFYPMNLYPSAMPFHLPPPPPCSKIHSFGFSAEIFRDAKPTASPSCCSLSTTLPTSNLSPRRDEAHESILPPTKPGSSVSPKRSAYSIEAILEKPDKMPKKIPLLHQTPNMTLFQQHYWESLQAACQTKTEPNAFTPHSLPSSTSIPLKPQNTNVMSISPTIPLRASKVPPFDAEVTPSSTNSTNIILVDERKVPLNFKTEISALNSTRRNEPPRFTCDGCGKSYATFGGLSKHKRFHCTSEVKKEFSCKYCEKKYSSLGALKMHIRTHTLPCKCPLCGKAFSRPWLLQGHLRTHTGEKPFKCTHCARAFADRSNLRAHLQTHTDIKKYSCKTCSKTFSRMSLQIKHEENCAGRMVSRMQPIQC